MARKVSSTGKAVATKAKKASKSPSKGLKRKGDKTTAGKNSTQTHRRTQDTKQRLAQREAELAVINSVQEGLASKLDMQAIYDLVGDKIRDIFDAQTVVIARYDLATETIHFNYHLEMQKRTYAEPIAFTKMTRHLIRTRQIVLMNKDLEQRVVEYGIHPNPGTSFGKSALWMPLIVGDEVRGVINLANLDHEDAFSDSDVHLLQTIANSMSVALENARLFAETQRLLKETEQRNAELAIINSVQSALAAQLDIHAIFEAVGDKLREIFSYQDVTIYYGTPNTDTITVEYTFAGGQKGEPRIVPMNSAYEYFITSNKTFVFNGDLATLISKFSDYINPDPPQSLLAVPVRRNKDTDPIVYLTLQDWSGTKFFSDSDVRLMETLANSMSVALENARLMEQEKMYRKALQRELEIGREIQAGFLPETLPQVEGWEIAASLMSAREVAGDFYDAFELPDGTIGLVIADVCDKGVGATLFMTLFRSLIRAVANLEYFEHTESVSTSLSTAERLKRAMQLTNNYIAETHGESGMFATLFFGILNPRDGRLAYVNGGHEPPLIIREGVVREMLRKTGPAVGVVMDGHFELGETQLQTGDMFIAFTDGVPDCKDPRGEFYGRKRLLDILKNASGSSLGLVHEIEDELRQYIAGSNQFDDITILAVKATSRS